MIRKSYKNGDEYDPTDFVDSDKQEAQQADNELDELNKELETYGDSPMTRKIFGQEVSVVTRKTKAEMAQLECPNSAVGHRCCQKCKLEHCVHYVDETLPADSEDYGGCLLWIK